MSNTPYFDVVVGRTRGDKKHWHKIGRAWFHAGTKDREENLSIDLNSAPPSDGDVKLFPPDDQDPVRCADRFSIVVPIDRTNGREENDGDAQTYWHAIGTAFHNPPSDDRAENFNLLFDSLPLTGRVLLFPAEAAEKEQTRRPARRRRAA